MAIRTKDVRGKILNAASDLIIENGLQSSMSEIAKYAEISVGNMYNYFQSKEDMIISLFEDLVLTIKNDITNNFKQTGDYKNDFFELFILHSKFIRQNPKTNKLFDYFSFSPYLKHKVKYDICYEITLFVNNFIQKGQNDGFITKVFDSLSIKKMIISCIKGFFDNWSPDETQHQVSDEEISNLITLIWNMISI